MSTSAVLLPKHKHTSKCFPCQEQILQDPQVLEEIIKSPDIYFGSLTARQLKVLDYLLYWANRNRDIYVRQDTIARFVGYKSREQVNRILKMLCEAGIVSKQYRHKTSCLYKVSSFFNDIHIRSQLKKFLIQLSFIPILLLMGDVTQCSRINLLISNRSIDKTFNNINNACAREKKVRSMIKDYVEEIQSPNLTQGDKISLSRYSEGAIRHALIQLQRQKEIRNSVGFLFVCARSFDEKNKSRPYSSNKPSQKEEAAPKKEPVYRVFSKEEQDRRRLNKLVYLAEVRGESQEYIDTLLSDTRRIVQIENSEWERAKEFNKNPKPVTNSHSLEYTTSAPEQVVNNQKSIRELVSDHFKID